MDLAIEIAGNRYTYERTTADGHCYRSDDRPHAYVIRRPSAPARPRGGRLVAAPGRSYEVPCVECRAPITITPPPTSLRCAACQTPAASAASAEPARIFEPTGQGRLL